MDDEDQDEQHIAHGTPVFLIDQLRVAGIINADQHFYGSQMIAMRMALTSPVAMRGYMFDRHQSDGRPPPEFPIEDMDFVNVLRRLRHVSTKYIICTLCDENAQRDRYDLLVSRGVEPSDVRTAFALLTESIQALWENKARIKKQLEDAQSACAPR